nr:MAG TPA: hypothetical protein [Caudoviricetes sp.]
MILLNICIYPDNAEDKAKSPGISGNYQPKCTK